MRIIRDRGWKDNDDLSGKTGDSMNNRRFALVVFLLLLLTAGCAAADGGAEPEPEAVGGVLDLTGWSFETNGTVALRGEWYFYWNKLWEPKGIEAGFSGQRLAEVPGVWNDMPVEPWQGKRGQGYATYRLNIILDPEAAVMFLKVPHMSTAYTLWINGEKISSNGTVGTTPLESLPQFASKAVSFLIPADGNLDIVAQVSNFDHAKGGMRYALELGMEGQILVQEEVRLGIEMFLLGSLLFMGLYHLGLFIFRNKEKSVLYFGLFCIIASSRILLVGEAYIYRIIPDMNWHLALKLEYLTFYLAIPLAALFVYSLFPREMSKRILLWTLAVGLVFSLFVILTPAILYTRTNAIYQGITIAACFYFLYVMAKALYRRREGAGLTLVGGLFYAFTVMLDILYYNGKLSDGDFASMGLFVTLFTQSFLIARRFSRAYSRVEEMSEELRDLNSHLEVRISERTEELVRMEKARRRLLSNISHDLNTPITLIQGYVEALATGMVQEEDKRQKYLEVVLKRINGLNRLIKDLFELSKLEARQIEFDYKRLTVNQLISHFGRRYEWEILDAGILFELETSPYLEQAGEQLQVQADVGRLDRVFTNLIYNAIKHTPTDKGMIRLQFAWIGPEDQESPGKLQVAVIDNGRGIDAKDLPFVFERFYKNEKSRNPTAGGSGLGLAICKEVMESHNGRIWAVSLPGQGSSFCFELPVEPCPPEPDRRN